MSNARSWRKEWRSKAQQGTRHATGKAKAQGTHTFTVQKPYCCAMRDTIYTALQPYGVDVLEFNERTTGISLTNYAKMMKIELRTFENLKYGIAALAFLPKAIEGRVTVRASQAEWAEYLIERTMRLAVTGGRINERSRELADKHNGTMPAAWNPRARHERTQSRNGGITPPNEDNPWIETGCKDGHAVWKAVLTATEEARRKR